MNTNQLEVVKWWHLGREYQKGVALLARFCRNKVLINTLMKKTERYGRGKLEYQLPKAVKLNFRKMPELPELPELPNDIESSDANELPVLNEEEVSGETHVSEILQPDGIKVPIISDKPLGQYPKVIRRLKYEYSELYMKRGVFHKSMGQVPELNTPQNITDRKVLFDQLKEISARMDFLYSFILDYENNNIIPAENIIWPVAVTGPEPELESIKQLTHKRSLLLNGNYKDNNQLRFQQIKKADKDNPMPDGPKKEKIKLRVKKREAEILAIDNKLIEIEKKDAGTSE